jgi:hypothetical protein
MLLSCSYHASIMLLCWCHAAAVGKTPSCTARPPAPRSFSTRVSSVNPCSSLRCWSSVAEMRRTTRSRSRRMFASRSSIACSRSVDGGRLCSSTTRRLSAVTFPGSYPASARSASSFGRPPPRAAPDGPSVRRRRATPASLLRRTAPARVRRQPRGAQLEAQCADEDDAQQRQKLHPPRHALEDVPTLGPIATPRPPLRTRRIAGPPARPARTPARRSSRRTPAQAAGPMRAAPLPRPSATRRDPSRRGAPRAGRPAASTRSRGPRVLHRAGASDFAAWQAARTAARTRSMNVGAAPQTAKRGRPKRRGRVSLSDGEFWHGVEQRLVLLVAPLGVVGRHPQR